MKQTVWHLCKPAVQIICYSIAHQALQCSVDLILASCSHTQKHSGTSHLVQFNGHFCKALGVNPISKKPLERACSVHLICIQTGPQDPHPCLLECSYSSVFFFKGQPTGYQVAPQKNKRDLACLWTSSQCCL